MTRENFPNIKYGPRQILICDLRFMEKKTGKAMTNNIDIKLVNRFISKYCIHKV